MAQAFFGRFTCPLDEKNRAVLPLRLREAVEPNRLKDGFVVTLGFEGCLLLFLRDRWQELVAEIEKLPFTEPKARLFKRFFFSSAQEITVDKIGRLTVADFQREAAGIGRELIFNGMGDHVEIWAPDRWKAYCDQNVDRYGEVAASLLGADGGAPHGAPGCEG
jgi:MraZ protein